MQNQECSEFRELLAKKGLTQKDTAIHALIKSYYIEHPIEISNLLNVSECYEWIFFFFIHTEAMTEEFGEVQYQKK